MTNSPGNAITKMPGSDTLYAQFWQLPEKHRTTKKDRTNKAAGIESGSVGEEGHYRVNKGTHVGQNDAQAVMEAESTKSEKELSLRIVTHRLQGCHAGY